MNINALKRKRNQHRGFMGKPDGTIPLERHMRGWNYYIKIDLRVLRWGGGARWGASCLGLGQVAGICVHSDELAGSVKCGAFLD